MSRVSIYHPTQIEAMRPRRRRRLARKALRWLEEHPDNGWLCRKTDRALMERQLELLGGGGT